MPNAPLAQLTDLGQSVWLDFIKRDLLNGRLQELITEYSVRGETSNPTIFDKAITGSDLYDTDVRECDSSDPEDIFYELAITDIRRACEIFRPLYDESDGGDGYVSIEVSPRLAYDTDTTISEAERLWNLVGAPNVMIKIPGTEPGLPAIEASIAKGINVNVTLLFSTDRHMEAADAYISGIHKAKDAGIDVGRIHSVASFFVSRVDTLIDSELQEIGGSAEQLQGMAAVANAKIAYQRAKDKFAGDDWDGLASAGANVQRPLWASTSTKNPDYSDVMYVHDLIGPGTVNTVPEATLMDFADHGKADLTLEQGVDEAYAAMERLAEAGIDMKAVTDKLEHDGVDSFAKSYEDLLSSIADKRSALVSA